MVFQVNKWVRIQHCDSAGVVFTPEYFNLFIEVIEDWFSESLNYSYSKMITQEKSGTPAMKIIANFHKPSKLGDLLHFNLVVKRLRKKTALLYLTAYCLNEKRCTMEFLYGFSKQDSISLVSWKEDLYKKMGEYLEE